MENEKGSNVVFNSVLNETNVFTLANHKDHTNSSEPIKTQSKFMQPTQSARKRVPASFLKPILNQTNAKPTESKSGLFWTLG